MPDLENHGAEAAAAPADCTELLRIVALPVDEVHLIEYVPRLLQADAVFSLDVPALHSIEIEPHRLYNGYTIGRRRIRPRLVRGFARKHPPENLSREQAMGSSSAPLA
jgi:hypothetical protein